MVGNDRADSVEMHMFNDLRRSMENLFIADATIQNCPYAYYLHWEIERSKVDQGSDETLCEMGRGVVPGGLHLHNVKVF